MYQRLAGSLQEFDNDIARSSHGSYPHTTENITGLVAIKAFTVSARDAETKQALIRTRTNSLAEALSKGLEIEAAERCALSQYVWVKEAEHPSEETEQVLRTYSPSKSCPKK